MKRIVLTLQVAGERLNHLKDWKYAVDLLLVVLEGLFIVIGGQQ
jgi:hypothetical protein